MLVELPPTVSSSILVETLYFPLAPEEVEIDWQIAACFILWQTPPVLDQREVWDGEKGWGRSKYCWWFRNPAKQLMVNIPLFTRFYTSQEVQDFFHQQMHFRFSNMQRIQVQVHSIGCGDGRFSNKILQKKWWFLMVSIHHSQKKGFFSRYVGTAPTKFSPFLK